MIEKLGELPQKIYEAERDLINKTNTYHDGGLKAKQTKEYAMFEVANQIDADGKAIYSNDIKRKAEVEIRLKANQEFNHLEESLIADKLQLELDRVKLEFLKRLFRSYEGIAQIR